MWPRRSAAARPGGPLGRRHRGRVTTGRHSCRHRLGRAGHVRLEGWGAGSSPPHAPAGPAGEAAGSYRRLLLRQHTPWGPEDRTSRRHLPDEDWAPREAPGLFMRQVRGPPGAAGSESRCGFWAVLAREAPLEKTACGPRRLPGVGSPASPPSWAPLYPNFCVEAPSLQVTVSGDEVTVGAPCGIGALGTGTPDAVLPPSPREDTARRRHCERGTRSSPGHSHAGAGPQTSGPRP